MRRVPTLARKVVARAKPGAAEARVLRLPRKGNVPRAARRRDNLKVRAARAVRANLVAVRGEGAKAKVAVGLGSIVFPLKRLRNCVV